MSGKSLSRTHSVEMARSFLSDAIGLAGDQLAEAYEHLAANRDREAHAALQRFGAYTKTILDTIPDALRPESRHGQPR